MDKRAPKPDNIGAAIAAVEAPAPVAMQQVNVTISSTGRPAAILIPTDATDAELAEFAGWILTSVLMAKRTEAIAAAGPQIEVVRSMPTIVRN